MDHQEHLFLSYELYKYCNIYWNRFASGPFAEPDSVDERCLAIYDPFYQVSSLV